MDHKELERFRRALAAHKDALLNWLKSDACGQELHLGGSAKSDVFEIITELKDALSSIEKGDFGKCAECSSEVETERLKADFTACVCLDHYSVEQIRSLESELELVSRVQRDLLPCKVPGLPGVEVAVRSQSAGLVGGDYYDFFTFQNGKRGLVIADVMDKGLPAGMLMSNLQASIRILGPQFPGPDVLTHRLNKLFRCNLNLIRFISLFSAAIDLESKSFEYCNAGHHPPIWWRASSQSFQWLNPGGPAIGLTLEPEYKKERLQFGSGDIFVLYTDGLVEARNGVDNEFGEKRLMDYVAEHRDDSPDALLNGLFENGEAFAGSFHDDVTLMVLKVK